MDSIDIGRRKALGMLAATVAFAASAAIPNKVLADTKSRNWPLWSIRQGGKTIYLTGETPPRPTSWHDDRIEGLLTQCSSFWTETNNVYKQPQGELINRYGIDPKRPLDSWLNAHDKARLAEAAQYCGVQLDDLAPYKPWLAAGFLQPKFYETAGWKGKSAPEVLSDRATHAGIPWHSEFKTKDDVLAWFGAFTPLQNVQFLRYVIDEILAGPAADARTFEDWAAGRREAATAEVNQMSRLYPELAQRIASTRNQEWLPRFEKMFASEGPSLVVVGLYHMVGPFGILALVKGKGLVVESI
ncbi:MAG: TraB/GumN family protein [Rhodanobacter sp.]